MRVEIAHAKEGQVAWLYDLSPEFDDPLDDIVFVTRSKRPFSFYTWNKP
jgi:hypothetical protein